MYRSLVLACIAATCALAQPASPQQGGSPRAIAHYNLAKKGLALQGYDPVSYRREGGGSPAKGKKELEVHFAGASYRFATPSNRDRFLEDPQRFEPLYGGWCAWAMSKGEKVEVDAESFLVEGDKLLVFYDGWFNDTREKWLDKGGEAVRPVADGEWKTFAGEAAGPPVASPKGLGLGGFDPASYSDSKEPSAGSESITTLIDGVRYRFVNSQNRQAFLRDPSQYLPLFGGHAAVALTADQLVPGDPKLFVRANGALVLFQNEAGKEAWSANSKKAAEVRMAWSRLLAKRGKNS